MSVEYYEIRLHQLLTGGISPELERRLSTMADRDLAIALSSLIQEDRLELLSHMPAAKAFRVRQESEYLSRLRVSASQRRLMAERLIALLEGENSGHGGTWIVPGRR